MYARLELARHICDHISIFGDVELSKRVYNSLVSAAEALGSDSARDDGKIAVFFSARYKIDDEPHSVGGQLTLSNEDDVRSLHAMFTYWSEDIGDPPDHYNSMTRLKRFLQPVRSEWRIRGRGVFIYPTEEWDSRLGLPRLASADQKKLGYNTITGISMSSESDVPYEHHISVHVNSAGGLIIHDLHHSVLGSGSSKTVRNIFEALVRDSSRFIERKDTK